MQGFAFKKKEEKQLEEEKKKLLAAHAHVVTMSEGPMQLKETQKVEQMARTQFEKSVGIELEAIVGKKKKGKKKSKEKEKKLKIR